MNWYQVLAGIGATSLLMSSVLPVFQAAASPVASSHTPSGQLTRRGIAGEVVGAGGSSIVVATHWGNVTVGITGATEIRRPPEGAVGADEIETGDRVAVLLDRAPVEPEPSPTPTPTATSTPEATPTPTATTTPEATPTAIPAPSFREVTALSIVIIPSKVSRSHERVVVTQRGNGKVKFLKQDGVEEEVDGQVDSAEGEDAILLLQDDGSGGESIAGEADPDEIDARLTGVAGKNPELAERITAKKLQVQQDREERLARTLANAPQDRKDKAQAALERSTRGSKSGASGSNSPANEGPSGPQSGGRPDDSGPAGRGNGDDGQGNRGQGGGKPDDSGNSGGNQGKGGGKP